MPSPVTFNTAARRASESKHPEQWDGLVAAWPLFEGGGTTAFDWSGNGTHATLSGSPSWAATERGAAVAFSGSSQYGTITDSYRFTFSSGASDMPFSVGAWMSTTSLNIAPILDKYDAGSDREWVFGITSNRLYGWVYDKTLGGHRGRYIDNLSSLVSVNELVYYCWSYDGSGTTAGTTLFINGTPRASISFSGGSYTAMRNSAAPVSISGPNVGLGWPSGVRTMQAVTMYDRQLGEDEWQYLYALGPNAHLIPRRRRSAFAAQVAAAANRRRRLLIACG